MLEVYSPFRVSNRKKDRFVKKKKFYSDIDMRIRATFDGDFITEAQPITKIGRSIQ